MITLTAAQQTALAKRELRRRLFVWCDALDPDTGNPDPAGFWDDVGQVEYLGRTYHGSGNVIRVETLAAGSDFSIAGLRVTLSGLTSDVANLVRGSTVGQRPLEVHTGLFDPDTHAVIGPLIKRFDGVVDDIVIRTPEAGGSSTVMLICESTARALTFPGTGTRSDGTHHERDASDDFFKYTNLQREKPIYFGRQAPRPDRRTAGGGSGGKNRGGDTGGFKNPYWGGPGR